jgi:hypothetical protein
MRTAPAGDYNSSRAYVGLATAAPLSLLNPKLLETALLTEI